MTDRSAAITQHLGIRFASAHRFEAPILLPFDASSGPFDQVGAMSPQVPGMLENLLGAYVIGTELKLSVNNGHGISTTPTTMFLTAVFSTKQMAQRQSFRLSIYL